LSFPRKRESGLANYFIIEILPIWIDFFDQCKFPFSLPLLDLFLLCNCLLNVFVFFEIDKMVNLLFIRKPVNKIALVFIDPFDQNRGHPNVESSVSFTG